MRTITTSKGNEYEVQYAYAPLMDGSCGIALDDTRRLSEVAGEFDGLKSIHLVDTDVGESTFDGYTELTQITRVGQTVTMKLMKGDE